LCANYAAIKTNKTTTTTTTKSKPWELALHGLAGIEQEKVDENALCKH